MITYKCDWCKKEINKDVSLITVRVEDENALLHCCWNCYKKIGKK